jgi:hypothetical protein
MLLASNYGWYNMLFASCYWSVILLIVIDQGSVILSFYQLMEGWQTGGGSIKVLSTLVEGR